MKKPSRSMGNRRLHLSILITQVTRRRFSVSSIAFPEGPETHAMALADDIRNLASRTVSALNASHDYYTYTKRVWRLLSQIVKEGRTFTFRNLTTGTTVDEKVLLGRAGLYVT